MKRAVFLEDLQNGYTWGKHIFKITNKEDLKTFIKSKDKQVGMDKNFNVPVFINFIGLDCILLYKDGTKVLSRYDENKQGFKFTTNQGIKTLSQLKAKVDSIIFLDEFTYHESFRNYWSENGLSGKVYKHKETFLNGLLVEF